jgi:hypothetical protein
MTLFRGILLVFIVPLIARCQTDSTFVRNLPLRSDRGHWLMVTTGRTVYGDPANQWLVVAGYDGRIGDHLSFPIETFFLQDATRPQRWWFALSAGLKERIRIPSIKTTLDAEGEIGFGIVGAFFNYGAGCDVALIDRLALTVQARQFASAHVGQTFLSVGISINATSKRLRDQYDSSMR